MTFSGSRPDLDAIARNLIALDLAYLTPEESTAYENELSAIASLNDALETTTQALKLPNAPNIWQRLHPQLSDAAALLASQLAPLFDLNAERHAEMSAGATGPPRPLAGIVSPQANNPSRQETADEPAYFHIATRHRHRIRRRRYQHRPAPSPPTLQTQIPQSIAHLTLPPF